MGAVYEMSEELCFLSAVELHARVVRREVSPVEITRAVLARAERLQPTLKCFITLCGDEALAQARRAEQAVMAGEPLGLLHGVPFTVKDLVNTQGVRTTFGAVPHQDNVPDHDAVAVARLREHGAILIGKTTTPEFGSKCLTDSPLFGRTRNAWSSERTSDGSSGGAAVAVASGIAPLAVATDGGGSTRIPSVRVRDQLVWRLRARGDTAGLVAKVEQMFLSASGDASAGAKLEALGLEVVATSGKELARRILTERNRWKPIVEASGFVAED